MEVNIKKNSITYKLTLKNPHNLVSIAYLELRGRKCFDFKIPLPSTFSYPGNHLVFAIQMKNPQDFGENCSCLQLKLSESFIFKYSVSNILLNFRQFKQKLY